MGKLVDVFVRNIRLRRESARARLIIQSRIAPLMISNLERGTRDSLLSFACIQTSAYLSRDIAIPSDSAEDFDIMLKLYGLSRNLTFACAESPPVLTKVSKQWTLQTEEYKTWFQTGRELGVGEPLFGVISNMVERVSNPKHGFDQLIKILRKHSPGPRSMFAVFGNKFLGIHGALYRRVENDVAQIDEDVFLESLRGSPHDGENTESTPIVDMSVDLKELAEYVDQDSLQLALNKRSTEIQANSRELLSLELSCYCCALCIAASALLTPPVGNYFIHIACKLATIVPDLKGISCVTKQLHSLNLNGRFLVVLSKMNKVFLTGKGEFTAKCKLLDEILDTIGHTPLGDEAACVTDNDGYNVCLEILRLVQTKLPAKELLVVWDNKGKSYEEGMFMGKMSRTEQIAAFNLRQFTASG
jgi:hypothetical protein